LLFDCAQFCAYPLLLRLAISQLKLAWQRPAEQIPPVDERTGWKS